MTKKVNILHQHNQINISIAHSAHYFKRLLAHNLFCTANQMVNSENDNSDVFCGTSDGCAVKLSPSL